MSYLGKALATPASILPATVSQLYTLSLVKRYAFTGDVQCLQVTDAFTQSRAFAQLKLPKAGEYMYVIRVLH